MMDLSTVTKAPACVQREIPGTETEWTGTSESLKPSAATVCQGPIAITAHHKTYGWSNTGQGEQSSTEKVCKVNP